MGASSPSPLRDLATAVRESNGDWKRPAPAVISPTPSQRRVGMFRDAYVFVALGFLTILVFGLGWDYDGLAWIEARGTWVLDIVLLILGAIYLAMNVLFGTTPGKASAGMRVFPLSRGRMLVRWALQCTPLLLGLLVAVAGLYANSRQSEATFVETFASAELPNYLVPFALLLVVVGCVFPVAGGQTWYDHFAGTRIIRKTRAREAAGFEPIFPSARRASDVP